MNIIIKNISDYFKLYDVLKKEIADIDIKIIIEKSFLEPLDILIITLFVIKQTQRNCNISIDATPNILEYLNAINIVDFCKKNSKKATTIEAISSYTAMPIRRVEMETMIDYIIRTKTYFKYFCQGKDMGMLELCLAELINNVYNHAHSSIGAYVFCQYYPAKEQIILAVADLGIGIPMAINSFMKSENKKVFATSKECVSWALKEHNTTQSTPQNRGKGLDNVQAFMKANDMSWKLYSDDVLLNAFPSGFKYEQNPISFFKGTIAQLIIKPKNLQNIEIFEELDWF